jgi:hypothetical protein
MLRNSITIRAHLAPTATVTLPAGKVVAAIVRPLRGAVLGEECPDHYVLLRKEIGTTKLSLKTFGWKSLSLAVSGVWFDRH